MRGISAGEYNRGCLPFFRSKKRNSFIGADSNRMFVNAGYVIAVVTGKLTVGMGIVSNFMAFCIVKINT